MRRLPPKSTLEQVARPTLPEPNDRKSPAPPSVVQCGILMVENMGRTRLDDFTRRTEVRRSELEWLNAAILRRRAELAPR
jgi:hypothetical protein